MHIKWFGKRPSRSEHGDVARGGEGVIFCSYFERALHPEIRKQPTLFQIPVRGDFK